MKQKIGMTTLLSIGVNNYSSWCQQDHNTMSEDFKISAVEYYLISDKNQLEICEIFNCSARSLMRWVSKYEDNGSIQRYNRTPVAYKVSKGRHTEIVKALIQARANVNAADEDGCTSLHIASRLYGNRQDPDCSESQCGEQRWLDFFGYRVSLRPYGNRQDHD